MRQKVQRFGKHDNAFGLLRLILASLVIVSHTPEIVDGNRNRELFTRVFHTISFGDFAVNGFFVISGFLITGSYLSSYSPWSYLWKRVARIYPGFIVASLFCVLVVGPVTGAYFTGGLVGAIVSIVGHIALLLPPAMKGVFPGTNYAVLNGAAWTIQYEFACYLVIILLGQLKVLRSGPFVGCAAVLCLALATFAPSAGEFLNSLPFNNLILIGDRIAILRLLGLFLAGGFFYLKHDQIPVKLSYVVISVVLLSISLRSPTFVNFGFAIFGAYALMAIASLGSGTVLSKINNRNDISYGVYLYAWPIEKMLIWAGFGTSVLFLGTATFALAAIAGAVSWFVIEKPAMKLGRPSIYQQFARRDGGLPSTHDLKRESPPPGSI
ncbi:acyltransferase [Sphingomonas flavescens]|uniref:acyltransferase family protein n=1 Tax=Sphingomonas flavescens TaxID=3132797 RepID=UPI0028038594|nr:acyltransferase [Sphingomonas limnosediminicola]